MSQEFEGVYLPTEQSNVYQSTPLANAGWYTEGQHGGAFSALIAGHVERTIPTISTMQVSRLTVEIFRVIKLVDLRIETEVIRQGKRIQTVVAHIFDPDDVLLSQATIQRLRTADLPIPEDARPGPAGFVSPDEVEAEVGEFWGVGEPGQVMFHRHAIEVKESRGGFFEKGPGSVWMRLLLPMVAGIDPTPLERTVATADFCNGVSRALDYDQWVFMNPDLTVHISRYPAGEWIGLAAESAYGDEGRGVATGTLWDDTGWLGRSTQSLYLDHTNQ